MAVHFFSEKFHLVLTRYWRVITFLFFRPVNMSSTWRHKFYWFWLILTAYFGQFLIWNYSSLNLYNSGTRKDIKKRQTAIFLIFAALSNSGIKKKHFICTLRFTQFNFWNQLLLNDRRGNKRPLCNLKVLAIQCFELVTTKWPETHKWL